MPKIPDAPKASPKTPEKKYTKSGDAPEKLRPYIFHGVDLDYANRQDAIGDCPFCSREKKFRVNVETGLFRCLVCAEGTAKGGGNMYTFMRAIHQLSMNSTSPAMLDEIRAERGFMGTQILTDWGVCVSCTTGDIIVPGYGVDKKLNQLYRYLKQPEGKYRLIPTPGAGHQLHGLETYSGEPEWVFLCEGPWDGMALQEAMRHVKLNPHTNEYALTTDLSESMVTLFDVVAVPGCNVFNPGWASLFKNKNVYIVYDNDYPRTNPKTGSPIESAGYAGSKRVTQILCANKGSVPKGVGYLRWGDEGQSHSQAFPDGHDVRDHIVGTGTSPEDRMGAVADIVARLENVPYEWVEQGAVQQEVKSVGVKECNTHAELIAAWKKAMLWGEGLESALNAMLASCMSTMLVGDQLWMKIYGPPSCGKSTLCEAISTSNHVYAKSSFRGFLSGAKAGEDGEDTSMVTKVNGKTLVTKDGDTLLQLPNLGQVLSEGRDIYDGATRANYRTGKDVDYLGIRMTWILCGTSSLRQLDQSELGARFLDCVIMDGIDDALEDAVLTKVAHRSERNMSQIAGLDLDSHQDSEMTEAMRLTGGYVDFLRNNAVDLMAQTTMSESAKSICARLGKFTAIMRARPSERQKENAEREFAARLTSQLTRLAKCTAVVMNEPSVGLKALKQTHKIALDTSRGVTYDIVRLMFNSKVYDNRDGWDHSAMAILLNKSKEDIAKLLRFLKDINAVEYVRIKRGNVTGPAQWRLTDGLFNLYKYIHIDMLRS